MIGSVVAHKLWGNGTVVEQTDKIIIVRFDIGDKRFVFPTAFDNIQNV